MWHKVGTNVGKALERRVSRAAGGVGRYVRKESRSETGVGGGEHTATLVNSECADLVCFLATIMK